MEQDIGDISNYYGGLTVKEENGLYYWSIYNYDGHNWEEIPKYLYDALIQYESERTGKSEQAVETCILEIPNNKPLFGEYSKTGGRTFKTFKLTKPIVLPEQDKKEAE